MSTKNVAVIPASVLALTKVGTNAAASLGASGGDAFGRFTKHGAWEFGQENIEVEEGSEWAINPLSMRHGFIHWPEEGRPTEITVPLTDPAPLESDLPQVNDDNGWNKTATFTALCIAGEDEGQQVLFKGSSLGWTKCVTKLAQAIGNRAIAGESTVVPVAMLESTFYTHKSYGRINTPELNVVRWIELDGSPPRQEPEQQEPEAPAETPSPTRRRRRVKK